MDLVPVVAVDRWDCHRQTVPLNPVAVTSSRLPVSQKAEAHAPRAGIASITAFTSQPSARLHYHAVRSAPCRASVVRVFDMVERKFRLRQSRLCRSRALDACSAMSGSDTTLNVRVQPVARKTFACGDARKHPGSQRV